MFLIEKTEHGGDHMEAEILQRREREKESMRERERERERESLSKRERQRRSERERDTRLSGLEEFVWGEYLLQW